MAEISSESADFEMCLSGSRKYLHAIIRFEIRFVPSSQGRCDDQSFRTFVFNRERFQPTANQQRRGYRAVSAMVAGPSLESLVLAGIHDRIQDL